MRARPSHIVSTPKLVSVCTYAPGSIVSTPPPTLTVPLLWPAWGANDWGFWRKLRHTLAVAIFALAAWLLWHWNLVGWKL